MKKKNHKMELSSQKENKINEIIDEKDLYQKSILHNIIESSIDYSIVGTDLEGKILVWNKGACVNYGYQCDEIISKKTLLFLHTPEDRDSGVAQKFIEKALANDKAEGSFERIRKDGSRFIASVMLAVCRNDEGKPIGFVMISKDITEAKRRENELIESNKELAQFAYVVSHDLKAPLRAIQSLATWVEEDNEDKLDEKSKENLALIQKRIMRMANLIDGILRYSRAGRNDVDIETVDTEELLKEIIDTLNLEEQFQICYPNYFPILVTPKISLNQVLSNLIGNCVKHHDKEKGIIRIDIEDAGEFYEFSVSDNGPGIDPKYFDKIFGIFQTLKSRDELEATGIGLSIVKKIIDSYGGTIKVESSIGEGTTMLFRWPKNFNKK